MKLYTFKKVQLLPVSLETAWDFMSDPKNLARITPKKMSFKTLSGDDRSIFPGQIIYYSITPVFSIKMNWVTEITHVIPNNYFVDEQRFGPYAFWHHKHFLKEVDGGVEMEDLIHYKIPFGVLGQLLNPLLVKPNLEEIFEFRRKTLEGLFGEMQIIRTI